MGRSLADDLAYFEQQMFELLGSSSPAAESLTYTYSDDTSASVSAIRAKEWSETEDQQSGSRIHVQYVMFEIHEDGLASSPTVGDYVTRTGDQDRWTFRKIEHHKNSFWGVVFGKQIYAAAQTKRRGY